MASSTSSVRPKNTGSEKSMGVLCNRSCCSIGACPQNIFRGATRRKKRRFFSKWVETEKRCKRGAGFAWTANSNACHVSGVWIYISRVRIRGRCSNSIRMFWGFARPGMNTSISSPFNLVISSSNHLGEERRLAERTLPFHSGP